MKKRLLFLPLLLAGTAATAQNHCPVKAKRYMRKMHLHSEEMYYVSKTDMVRRYASANKTFDFPNSPVYNKDGILLMVEGGQGKRFQVFSCFQTFNTDLDSFMHEAKFYKHVTDTADNAWMKQHVKRVYDTPEQTPGTYNFVMYYPAGMPMMRKKYAALVDRIRYYRQQGQDVRIWFVLVPLLKK